MIGSHRILYGIVVAVFSGNVVIAAGERPSAATFRLLVMAALLLLSRSLSAKGWAAVGALIDPHLLFPQLKLDSL